MRVSKRRALTLSALAGATLLWSGCEAKKQTEYVTGISTQVQVPRDLRSVRVDVAVGGVNVFCRAYKVYDGRVQLPRSLGQLPQSEARIGEPITVTIVGFTEEVSDPSRQNEFDCATQIQAGKNARILRRSRQPYLKDSILFLPMALRFSCFDKDCETAGQDKTCKAGKCVDATTDEKTLPVFSDDLVDGKGGACFNVSNCMGPAAPPVVVNPDDCTYAMPNTPSAPPVVEGLPPNPFAKTGDGVNVRIVYDGGYNAEILDNDPDEGFTIPDPAKPQQFRLAPGLCEMVKGAAADGTPVAHRITGVFASGVCQAKSRFQPLCEKDMLSAMGADPTGVSKSALVTAACNPTPLKPPKSYLIVLADSTSNSIKLGDQAGPAAISLSDPAFENTNLGLLFYPKAAPATPVCSGGAPPAGGFPFSIEPTQNARTSLEQLKTKWPANYANAVGAAPQAQTDLDGALAAAYTYLQGVDAYARGVLLLANHDFSSKTCGLKDAPTLAADAATAAKKVDTYVTLLASDTNPSIPDADNILAANILAANGTVNKDPGTGAGRPAYDARTSKSVAQSAFRQVVNDLATCVYDAPTSLKDDQVLSYTDPVVGATYLIKPDLAGCTNAKAPSSGWGKDASGRIIICGLDANGSCTKYRNVLQTAAAYSAQYLQPALAVPVFAHDPSCAPEEGGTPSGVPLPKP